MAQQWYTATICARLNRPLTEDEADEVLERLQPWHACVIAWLDRPAIEAEMSIEAGSVEAAAPAAARRSGPPSIRWACNVSAHVREEDAR